MPAAFQTLLDSEPKTKAVTAPAPSPASGFWKEFLRVQSDKFILLLLIILLHCFHSPENMQAAAVGGLIVLIQGQRFKTG